jgi:hypothetical protein
VPWPDQTSSAIWPASLRPSLSSERICLHAAAYGHSGRTIRTSRPRSPPAPFGLALPPLVLPGFFILSHSRVRARARPLGDDAFQPNLRAVAFCRSFGPSAPSDAIERAIPLIALLRDILKHRTCSARITIRGLKNKLVHMPECMRECGLLFNRFAVSFILYPHDAPCLNARPRPWRAGSLTTWIMLR